MKKAKSNNQKTVCKKNITLLCNEVISLTDMLFKELIEQIPKELFDEDTTLLKDRINNIQLIEMNKSRGTAVATFKNS